MNEIDWIRQWKVVCQTVEIIGPEDWINVPRPTDEHFDRLEKKLNFVLPLSYKTFIKVFGPGWLGRPSFPIYAPGYKRAAVFDMLGSNTWQEEQATRNQDPRVLALVAFSILNYDGIAWDGNQVSDPAAGEYKIVIVPQYGYQDMLPLADTFPAFVEDFCLDGGFARMFGGIHEPTWEDDETGQIRSNRCFEPLGIPPHSRI